MSAYADDISVFLKSKNNMAQPCESITSFNNLPFASQLAQKLKFGSE